MITRSEMIAALEAIGINAEVQVSLAGIPLDIVGLRLDDLRGVIRLELCEQHSEERLRHFLRRVTSAPGEGGSQEHTVRRNSRGHCELLHTHE